MNRACDDDGGRVSLRRFRPEDLPLLEGWCRAIDAGRYMSNLRPAPGSEAGGCAWYVIIHEDGEIGTVWLEKLPGAAGTVKLGILLGSEGQFGRGIGRRAVEVAIEEARAALDFRRVLLHVRCDNTRAIRCYRACGFEITGEFAKTDSAGQVIPAYEMVRELPHSGLGRRQRQ